jgi:hypothetical protein
MICSNCGEVVPAGIRFCGNCGAEVSSEDDRPQASDSGTILETGPAPYLVIVAGPGRGQTFDLTGQVRLGRSRSNAIVLSDGKVSRNHLRLDPIRGTYILTDLGSANGTSVNGVRITQPVRLHDGDLINVGDTQLIFHTGESEPVASPHHHVAAPPPSAPSPAPHPSTSAPAPPARGFASPLTSGNVPNWVWLGCAGLVVIALLLIVVALAAGILIGQGFGGI